MLDLCRGKGIGKYLMLATENYCKTLGRIILGFDKCCGPAFVSVRIKIQYFRTICMRIQLRIRL